MEDNQHPLTILAFFAHPDDETMFLGGTLAFLSELGAKIHFLSATRGEGGEMGDPPICARSELGRVREEELRCAVEALGGSSLNFLGFRDPEVGPEGELYPFSDDIHPVIGELKRYLQNIQPDVILGHGPEGEYGHPAHIQAHRALMAALEELDDQPGAVYAPAWLSRETGQFTPVPDFVVNIAHWIDRKVEAACCHRSQHGLFLRHGSARAGRPVTIPEMIRSREALCRILPVSVPGEQQQDLFADLLSEIALPVKDQA